MSDTREAIDSMAIGDTITVAVCAKHAGKYAPTTLGGVVVGGESHTRMITAGWIETSRWEITRNEDTNHGKRSSTCSGYRQV